MQRRSLLISILAGAMAPAIVRADSLMKIPDSRIWVPDDGCSYMYPWNEHLGCVFSPETAIIVGPRSGNQGTLISRSEWTFTQQQTVRRFCEENNQPHLIRYRLAERAKKAAKTTALNAEFRAEREMKCNDAPSLV